MRRWYNGNRLEAKGLKMNIGKKIMFSCSMKGRVDEKGKCRVVCVKRESALSRFCAIVARSESMSDVLSERKSA